MEKTEDPKCLYGGVLVGTRFPLPNYIKIYYKDKNEVVKTQHGSFTVVGCNRLYCSNCKAFVKNWAWYNINREAIASEKNKFAGTGSQLKDSDNLAKIYNTKDPNKQNLFAKSEDYRVYACNCSFFAVQSVYQLSLGDWADVDTWACNGHPQ